MLEEDVRKITLRAIAIFNDVGDCGELVFKGASALELIYGHPRSSRDLDFSYSDKIPKKKFEKCKRLFFDILQDTFSEFGYIVLRPRWEPRPPNRKIEDFPFWRGHRISFDIMPHDAYEEILARYPSQKERDKRLSDPSNYQRCRVDISEKEYTDAAQEVNFEGYNLKVYTSVMIVCEKLRAICQQTPDYLQKFGKIPKSRLRDFYDIYIVNQRYSIDWANKENLFILKAMFEVKEVDLSLLLKIGSEEVKKIHDHPGEFKRLEDTVKGELKDFEVYYNYVVKLAQEIWDNISSILDQN